jgi:hypothetical protein
MEQKFIYFYSTLTASAVMDWCDEQHIPDTHWKFQTTGAVFGAPTMFTSNRPTYKHPRRGTEEVHTGIMFFKEQDAVAFRLRFGL